MIGVVVDKSDCFPANLPNPELNGSLSNVTHAHDDYHALKHDIMMCKVGYATAVTMIGGIYQVTFLL